MIKEWENEKNTGSTQRVIQIGRRHNHQRLDDGNFWHQQTKENHYMTGVLQLGGKSRALQMLVVTKEPLNLRRKTPFTSLQKQEKRNDKVMDIANRVPWNKGKKLSKKYRQKLSDSHKGQVPWNKGLTKDTNEMLKKLSEKLTGRKGHPAWNKGLTKETDERVRKYGENGRGKHFWTKKNTVKISIKCAYCGKEKMIYPSMRSKNNFCDRKCLGMWLSENLVGKNHHRYGCKFTKLHLHRLSESHKGQIAWSKGRHLTEDHKRKVSESKKGTKSHRKGITYEQEFGKEKAKTIKQKMSIAKQGKIPVNKGKTLIECYGIEKANEILRKWMLGNNLQPNKQETKLNDIIQSICPNEYKYVGNGEFILGGRCPDFINCNGQKKIIELFGDYWHDKKITGCENEQEEYQRKDHFAKYGFQTLVIWEKELSNKDLLINKIKEFNTLTI